MSTYETAADIARSDVVGEPRVLVISASMGAGHDVAAGILAERLRARGAQVELVDLLALAPMRQGDLLRGFYRQMISRAPGFYDFVMRTWTTHPGFYEWLTAIGSGGYERGVARLIASYRPDVVVATYNLTAQLLGRMKQRGDIDLPCVSYITDPGAHRYWVAAGIDGHLVPMESTAAAMRAWDAANVQVVAPVVDERFLRARDSARRRAGPGDGQVVLVNGGSWGVGATAHTASVLAGCGSRPLVVCGRSASLYAAVAAVEGAEPVAWTDDMVGLIAKADLLVDNAGGMTCWEALAAGVPVVVHQAIAGHGRLNADALEAGGLAASTRTDAELRAALDTPPPDVSALFAQPDAADLIATLW